MSTTEKSKESASTVADETAGGTVTPETSAVTDRPRLQSQWKSLVFDIKRFAVHDGDGIRTTVFFKGCPLRCKWCQNPEGLKATRQPVYLKNQCIHCGHCKAAARPGQLEWKDNSPVLNHQYPGHFDEVVYTCPAAAIRYDSTPYDLDTLMEKIREDAVFFKSSGGVTFSGGEPFLQGHFLEDILKRCKAEGFHTAIESSFFADPALVKACAPYLDRIFADIKILDPEGHRQATGRDNTQILENIAWLLDSPEHRDKVIIRTPLIPGFTATMENVGDIARWISDHYPDVKYELLNYNPLASAKYEMTGQDYSLPPHPMFTGDEMNAFRQTARDNGVMNLIEE